MQDRADPHFRERALAVASQDPPSGVTPDEAVAGNAGRARFDRRHLPGSARPIAAGSERRETAPIRPSEQSEKPASCVSGILGRERQAFRWI
jgi:hypothetical protein